MKNPPGKLLGDSHEPGRACRGARQRAGAKSPAWMAAPSPSPWTWQAAEGGHPKPGGRLFLTCRSPEFSFPRQCAAGVSYLHRASLGGYFGGGCSSWLTSLLKYYSLSLLSSFAKTCLLACEHFFRSHVLFTYIYTRMHLCVYIYK